MIKILLLYEYIIIPKKYINKHNIKLIYLTNSNYLSTGLLLAFFFGCLFDSPLSTLIIHPLPEIQGETGSHVAASVYWDLVTAT